MADKILELRDVWRLYGSKQYEVVKALQGVSLQFELGEFVAIQGVSGSGKSTLLNVMSGMERVTRGTIYINGKPTDTFQQDDWDAYRKNNLGFIFQHFNLIDTLTALENVALVMSLSGISRADRMKRAEELLRQVGLGDRMYNTPLELSGGQKQRVAIARALANNPDIIMADEPTGALDSETAHEIMELLTKIGEHKLIVMVTHNEELARQYAERLIIMEDGLVKTDERLKESTTSVHQELKKKTTAMPFIESLRLSFRSMKSRWGRIAITAVAGSIGIAGVAITSGLGYGVNAYVDEQVNKMLNSNRLELNFGVRKALDQSWDVNLTHYVQWTIPTEERINQFVDTVENATWDYNIDQFVSQNIFNNMKYKDLQDTVNTMHYVTAKATSNPDVLSDYTRHLIEGSVLPQPNKPFEVVVNTAFILTLAEYDNIEADDVVLSDYLNKTLTKDESQMYLVRAGVTDTYELDFTLKITGIAEEMTLFSMPTLYYNHEALKDYLDTIALPNLSTSEGNTLSLLDPAQNQCQFLPESQKEYCTVRVDLILGTTDNITRQLKIIEQNDQIITYDSNGNPMQANGFQVISTGNFIMLGFQGILNTAQIILLIFVLIALFVSAILIAIVLYSSAIERRLEIGILKAVGARNKDVKRIFVAEALLIGSYAGVVGVALGFVAQAIVYAYSASILGTTKGYPLVQIPLIGWDFHSLGWYQYIPLLVPVGLVVIAIGVAYLAGMTPAKKATKMRVVDALREE